MHIPHNLHLQAASGLSRSGADNDLRTIIARLLDRAADHQLHLGHHHQAERLSRQAAELREGRA